MSCGRPTEELGDTEVEGGGTGDEKGLARVESRG